MQLRNPVQLSEFIDDGQIVVDVNDLRQIAHGRLFIFVGMAGRCSGHPQGPRAQQYRGAAVKAPADRAAGVIEESACEALMRLYAFTGPPNPLQNGE